MSFFAQAIKLVNENELASLDKHLLSDPVLGSYFSDYLLMSKVPGSIDYQKQPPRWKRSIRRLAMMFELTWPSRMAMAMWGKGDDTGSSSGAATKGKPMPPFWEKLGFDSFKEYKSHRDGL